MKLLTGILAGSLALGAGATAATLDGLTIYITSAHGTCLEVTAGAGEECSIFDASTANDDVIVVDVDATSIGFTFIDLTSFSSYLWSRAPAMFDVVISGFTGFTLTSQSYTAIGGQLSGSVSAAQTGAGEITMSFNDLALEQKCNNGMICGMLNPEGTVATPGAALTADASSTTANTANARSIPAVPLPASLPLLLAGLGGIGWIGRGRRRSS